MLILTLGGKTSRKAVKQAIKVLPVMKTSLTMSMCDGLAAAACFRKSPHLFIFPENKGF